LDRTVSHRAAKINRAGAASGTRAKGVSCGPQPKPLARRDGGHGARGFRAPAEDVPALCEGLIIRVDDFPTDEVLDDMQADDLLGLFHGIGLPQQSQGDVARLPNLVWLYAARSWTTGGAR